MKGGGSPLVGGGKGGPLGQALAGQRGPFGQGGGAPATGGYQPVDNQGEGPPSAQQNDARTAAQYGSPLSSMRHGTTTPMNIVFFIASCCVIIGAIVSASQLLFNGSFVDYLNLTYISLFGCVLALLDTPIFKTNRLCLELKQAIIKYVSLLTRVTGKGVCLIFLGCANLSATFANLSNVGDKLMSLSLSFITIFIGVLAISIGWMKSRRLKNMQVHLGGGVFDTLYRRYAVQYPEDSFPGEKGGLTAAEFDRLATENTRIKWDEADLKLIFNALVVNPSWRASGGGDAPTKVTKMDLQIWVNGSMVFL